MMLTKRTTLLFLSIWSICSGIGLIFSPRYPDMVCLGGLLCALGLVYLRNTLWAFATAYLYVLAKDSDTLPRVMKVVSRESQKKTDNS